MYIFIEAQLIRTGLDFWSSPWVQAPRFESMSEWSRDLDSNLGAWTWESAWTLRSACLCCCGREVANLKIYLLSATKQDRVGPSLLSRNPLLTFWSLLYILYRGTGSVDLGDTLCHRLANSPSMINRLVRKNKTKSNVKTKKIIKSEKKHVYGYANISEMLLDKKSPVNWEAFFFAMHCNGTLTQTDILST